MPWDYDARLGRQGPRQTPEERAQHLAEAEQRVMCAFTACTSSRSAKYDAPLCDRHVLHVWAQVQEQHEATVARSQVRLEDDRKAATREERMTAPGTIYYLRVGDHIKVGYASALESRLAAYPPTAELLATHPGTLRDEQRLHKRFAHYRAAGREWYEPHATLMQHIATVVAEHGEPKRFVAAKSEPRPPAIQMRRRSGPAGYRVA